MTINSDRPSCFQTNGDDHPEPCGAWMSRSILQRCLPVFASTAATYDCPSLSWTMKTRPSLTIGEAAVPKSRYIGCGSKCVFHSGLPSSEYANRPTLPKYT